MMRAVKCASNPAKNWSRKSARHLHMTRAPEMRVDTRSLPEAYVDANFEIFAVQISSL